MNKIEWTDRTWNPVRGCSRVSEGCRNCYAERMAARFSAGGEPFHGFAERHAIRTSHVDRRGNEYTQPSTRPSWTGRVELIPSKLDEPLRWRKPARVFVNSMSDLFHESLTDRDILSVFETMAAAPRHTFQVLTKRPQRMLEWFRRIKHPLEVGALARFAEGLGKFEAWPMPNVWLGVSVEDKATAYERIPLLLHTPAAVRFVSYEPALGPVTLAPFLYAGKFSLDWLIVGGESGPGARPCDVEWIRSAVRQAKEAGVACFVKQMGANVHDRNDAGFEAECETWADGPDARKPTSPEAWPTPVDVEDVDGDVYQGAPVRVRLGDHKGGDPSEWPEDLRVREFPA